MNLCLPSDLRSSAFICGEPLLQLIHRRWYRNHSTVISAAAAAIKYHQTGRPPKPPTSPASSAEDDAVRPSGGRRSLSALLIRLTAYSSIGAASGASGRTAHTPHRSNGPTVALPPPAGSLRVEPSGERSRNSPAAGSVTSAVAPAGSASRSSPWLLVKWPSVFTARIGNAVRNGRSPLSRF